MTTPQKETAMREAFDFSQDDLDQVLWHSVHWGRKPADGEECWVRKNKELIGKFKYSEEYALFTDADCEVRISEVQWQSVFPGCFLERVARNYQSAIAH